MRAHLYPLPTENASTVSVVVVAFRGGVVSFGLGSAVRVVTWVIVGSRWHVGDNLAARGPSASRSRRVEHIVHTVTLRGSERGNTIVVGN